jgi:Icc-related predicted phosphoesterase
VRAGWPPSRAEAWLNVRPARNRPGPRGTDRLAAPIAEHEPDLVLHGHAHAGTFEGAIGTVPVYNVSVPVIGRDFWLFELDVSTRTRAPIR